MGLRLPKANLDFKQKQNSFIVAVQNIIKKMTANTNFPTPAVPLASLQTTLDAYQAALVAAVKGSKAETATKNTAKKTLQNLVRVQQAYVQETAYESITDNHDATQIARMSAIILSSGFMISNVPGPVANTIGIAVPIVKKVLSTTAGHLNILLRQYAKFKKGVKIWQVNYRTAAHGTTPAGDWQTQTFSSGNITLTGLTSGVTYDYQIGAIGGHNTKNNSVNPQNFTAIQQVVII